MVHERYAASNLIENIKVFKGANVLQDLNYEYSSGGLLTSLLDIHSPESSTFANVQYDSHRRLKFYEDDLGQLVAFQYGGTGNILSNGELGAGSYAYNPANPHAVAGAPGFLYTYDDNGNVSVRLTSDGPQVFTYDSVDQVTRIASRSGNVDFGYDYGGSRLWKDNGTETRVYLDGIFEERASESLVYVSAGGLKICSISYPESDGSGTLQPSPTVIYHHSNHLASNHVNTDSSGNEVQRTVEKAFGSNRYVANPNGYLPTDRFTDQALDLETGLYWYGSRYYDPAVGRYLQPDDVVPAPFDTQGRNPYTYVRNNPLGLTDPTGNAAENILEWIWRRISGNDAMEGSGSGAPEGWDVPAPVWTAGSANGQLKKALDPIVEPVAKEIVRVVDKGANAAAAGFEDGSAAPYEVPTHIALTLAGTDFNVDPLSGYHNAFQSESGAGLFEKTMYGGGAIFGLMTWTLPAGKGASATLSSRPLLFGQKGVSNVFSHGVHKGKTLGTVAKGLREGKILADSLPINFVVRNGQRVTVNNRSLTALRMARKEPTIVVNKTGQRIWERRLTNNLKGSKGPSDTIRVRNGPPGTSNIE